MWLDRDELLYDLLTRDALLIKDRRIFQLDGPFDTREQALEAARLIEARMAESLATSSRSAAD